MKPHEVLDPTDDGRYQIKGAVIEDAVTRGRYALHVGGPGYAYQYFKRPLEELIEMKTWRSADAFDLLQQIQRQILLVPEPLLVAEVR